MMLPMPTETIIRFNDDIMEVWNGERWCKPKKGNIMQVKILDSRIENDFPDYPVHEMLTSSETGNAGFDLRAFFKESTVPDTDELILFPGTITLIPTGLAIHIKDTGIVGMIYPRSGLGHKHGIVVGNLTGVIDSSYQGQYMVSCWNRSDKPYTLKVGERIAQLVFLPVINKPTFEIVDEFTETSERGGSGFGDSGKH